MSDMPVNARPGVVAARHSTGVAAKKQGYGCHCEYHVCPLAGGRTRQSPASAAVGPATACPGRVGPDATDQDRPVYKCQCQHVDCKQEVVAP